MQYAKGMLLYSAQAQLLPGCLEIGVALPQHRCPGRAFAEMEVALFVATVLLRFDLQLRPQPPAAAAAKEPWWQRLLCPAAAVQVDHVHASCQV